MRCLLRFPLVLWLALTGLVPALAQDVNRAARLGVVKITATSPDPKAPARIGTGIVIRLEKGVAYVLTAAHVLDEGRRATVQFFPGGTGPRLAASELRMEGGNPHGLALFRVEGSIPGDVVALPLAGAVELQGGEAVTGIGHPVARGDWLLVNGSVSGPDGRVITVQMPVSEGNSGGPLLMQGRVVAIVLNDKGGGFAEVLPIGDAVRYARGKGVQPEEGALPVAPSVAEKPAAEKAVAPARQLRIAGPKPLYEPYRTGDIFQECAHCPEMVVIVPDREFTIGSPKNEKGRDDDEGPFGPIRFAAPYAIGRFEVTRAQFARSGVAGGKPCYQWTGSEWRYKADADWQDPKFVDFRQGDDHPVVCVNWDEARAYVQWLNTQRPAGAVGAYRLPSEAEWEYAARANTTSARFWGDNPDDACKYANVADRTLRARFKDWSWTTHDCEDGHVFTAPVGGGQVGGGYRFRPNAFGLYDMLSNAWEWTQDCYQPTYDAKIATGKAFEASGSCGQRVLRGGSWINEPGGVRSANRIWDGPGNRSGYVGFRVARTLP